MATATEQERQTRRMARALLSGGDLEALARLFGGDRARARAALRGLLQRLARRAAGRRERDGAGCYDA